MIFRKRKNRLAKLVALTLSILLTVNPLAASLAWAVEGEEILDQEEVVQEEMVEEVAGESEINTGDAEALVETESVVNQNTDLAEGEVTTGEEVCNPPLLEDDPACDEPIVNDNQAELGTETEALADTGENEIIAAPGDAAITTGEATAAATLKNEVNINTVEFVDPVVQEEEPASAEEPLVIANQNQVEAENEVLAEAVTGANEVSQVGGDAQIETGDALAYANVLNLLNTNAAGSDFELYFLDLLDGYEGNLDLNQIWQEVIEGEFEGLEINQLGDEEKFHLFKVLNSNLAALENDVLVIADSGQNQANDNQGEAQISTGDAAALANVVNLVNLNLIGSQFFLGVINIFGSFQGNLILPAPRNFDSGGTADSSSSPIVFSNQNEVGLDDTVQTTAQTGSNQTANNQGDDSISTGNALSQANTFSLLNTNIQQNNWFLVVVNHLGLSFGKIFGWSAPEAVEEGNGEASTVFQIGGSQASETADTVAVAGAGAGAESSLVANQNQAAVANNVQVEAETGQNQANNNYGGAQIITGQAKALANLVNLVNLNIFGSRWFLGLVNILGDWQGDVIFAYPDMVVNLANGLGQAQVGDVVHYQLTYENQGYDQASQANVSLELPMGIEYLNDTSGLTPVINGQTCVWSVGDIAPGQGGSFGVNVLVTDQFYFEEPQAARLSLVRQAHAAANEKSNDVTLLARVATVDPESDLANNQSAIKTRIYQVDFDQINLEETQSTGQPELVVTSQNNVNQFVYPGDTVTFEITVSNAGAGPAHDVYLTQTLFNQQTGEVFGTAVFEIGQLEPGRSGKLTFGFQLAADGVLPAGLYKTVAQAVGQADDGQEMFSNQAQTEFEIRLKAISGLIEARALGKEEDILGVCQTGCPDSSEKIWPHAVILLLASLVLVDKSKKVFGLQKTNSEKGL